ncbi:MULTISPECIES: TauD/TfdA family dioxygenase [unclassified Bradyrhizobium]|uniref:TauD/TfdA dioxygenase family protein n=1 Tax=unclassified Bradyrhizobium TaxID=2631580 RepID=UPI00247A3C94|nr:MULTISPECIES: TauD/TfdA family dioxygenase [unclassified Bradyrhizobium]WGS19252.1 TauD/TfdA family dioxygenase [Bradyrhizobium sp. ISRA463]WGS26088.1 TauD/TfdA family dioxygenase [Bradyrhizobium sp. ISRA464]
MSERGSSNSVIPGMDVIKRSARIGAEIRNIKLSSDLPDQTIAAIKTLLLEHKLIFFRDQGHLDDLEHERFARRFGKPALHPEMVPTEGTISVLDIDSARRNIQTDVWHVDWSCLDAYPKISVLRGVVIPPVGGDTVWSNTAAAYLDLPQPLQRLADALWAVHSLRLVAHRTEADKNLDDEALTRARFETEHPVVRIHPETGERALVLGSYVTRFVDVPKYDGQKLLDLFESHITAPENTVRWNWKQGDIAIWDNRATMHYAVDDYGEQRRIVRRAAVEGEVPVSVDGRCSVPRVKIIKQSSASPA